jgi:hypothetical protein
MLGHPNAGNRYTYRTFEVGKKDLEMRGLLLLTGLLLLSTQKEVTTKE